MTIPSEGITHFDIGWLAGIVDGEGSIVHYFSTQHDRRRGKHIVRKFPLSRIVIVNTDYGIVKRFAELLMKLDIVGYINQKCSSKKQRIGSFYFTKPCLEVICQRRMDVEKLARLIEPHLSGNKKQKALKLIEYFNTHPFNAGRRIPRVTTERLAPSSNLERLENTWMKLQSELTRNSENTTEMIVSS